MRLRIVLLTLAMLFLSATPAAHGRAPLDPDAEIARRHFDRGTALYDAGDYAAAIVEFEKAREVKPAPAFDYNIARCHDRLEHFEEAVALYEQFLKKAPDDAEAPALRQRIEVLKSRIAARKILAPAPPPPARRLGLAAPVATLAVAAALFAAGGGLYGWAGHEYDRFWSSCAPTCPPDEWHPAQAEERAGIALLAVGGAALVADAVLWAVYARGARPVRAARVTPSGLGVRF